MQANVFTYAIIFGIDNVYVVIRLYVQKILAGLISLFILHVTQHFTYISEITETKK